tara:strand:+ start:90 stop:200 length:111 start_codon:yes stop_codon:yes gene_type:complete
MTENNNSSRECPNCGRKLTKDEMWCYFCEEEIKPEE